MQVHYKTSKLKTYSTDVSSSPYSTLLDYWVAHSTSIWYHTTEKLDSYYKQLSTTNSGRATLGTVY